MKSFIIWLFTGSEGMLAIQFLLGLIIVLYVAFLAGCLWLHLTGRSS